MKRKTFTILLLIFLFSIFLGCSYLKVTRLLKSGEIISKEFKKEIKFEYKHHYIILNVKLNDNPKEYRFILDTGAFSMISDEIVNELKLKPVVNFMAEGTSRTEVLIPFFKIEKIDIDGITFKDIGVGIIDVTGIYKTSCLKVDGIIGSNLLRHCISKIDYKDNTLTITDRAESIPLPKGGYYLHFRKSTLEGFAPVFTCMINGEIYESIKLDTGYSGVISIPLSIFNRIGQSLESDYTIEGYGKSSVGAWGSVEGKTYLTRIKSIQLGDIAFENVLVKIDGNDFLLGNKFLENFLIRLDYSSNEVVFFPYQDKEIPHNSLSFGYGKLYKDGKLIVGFLWDKSPATEAGIKLGDEILAINGKSVVGLSFDEICKMKLDHSETIELFLLHEGITKSITLKARNLLP